MPALQVIAPRVPATSEASATMASRTVERCDSSAWPRALKHGHCLMQVGKKLRRVLNAPRQMIR
jgi:hypothetical protein